MSLLDSYPGPERVEAVFAADADALPEDVFRAVHQPARLDRGGERELLNVIGTAFITGSPGAGKSHLLRWLEIELCADGREVTRVPAGVSIDKILGRAVLPPAPAPAPVSKEELRDRLVTQLLQEQQRAQERVVAARQANTTPEPLDRDAAGWLAKGLADLLADPITAHAFLIEGKGAITRLAEREAASGFVENDFLRPDDIRFLEASRPAQTMLTKLSLASTNQFRAAAATLMNRVVGQLPSAGPPAAPPAPASWLLLEDVSSLPPGFPTGSAHVIAVVPWEEDVPADGDAWRIDDVTPSDDDFILNLIGAYLETATGPINDPTVEEFGRSPAGRSLFPFRRDDLLAAIFDGGVTRTTAGAILGHVRHRLLSDRDALAASMAPPPPAPLSDEEERRRAAILARRDEARAWLGEATVEEVVGAVQATLVAAQELALIADSGAAAIAALRAALRDDLLRNADTLAVADGLDAIRAALTTIDEARTDAARTAMHQLSQLLDSVEQALAEVTTPTEPAAELTTELDEIEQTLGLLSEEPA
jgi:hypothetical protein